MHMRKLGVKSLVVSSLLLLSLLYSTKIAIATPDVARRLSNSKHDKSLEFGE